jgi:hypothetical protein
MRALPDSLSPTLRSNTMTNEEIIDLFDSTNITLAELSAITGKSVKQLKTLLTGGAL